MAKETTTQNEHLYDWVFHFNYLTGSWAAIPRDCYNEYWSDFNHPRVIRSSSITTLQTLIAKVEKDPDYLSKLK